MRSELLRLASVKNADLSAAVEAGLVASYPTWAHELEGLKDSFIWEEDEAKTALEWARANGDLEVQSTQAFEIVANEWQAVGVSQYFVYGVSRGWAFEVPEMTLQQEPKLTYYSYFYTTKQGSGATEAEAVASMEASSWSTEDQIHVPTNGLRGIGLEKPVSSGYLLAVPIQDASVVRRAAVSLASAGAAAWFAMQLL